MTLILEANIVHFPEDRPHPNKDEEQIEWTPELREKYFHQEAEVHLIKLGPVDQELLDSKLVHMDLQGVTFEWNEKNKEYTWSSGVDLKGLPLKYFTHFKEELKKVGIEKHDRWSFHADNTSTCANVEKSMWQLEVKF